MGSIAPKCRPRLLKTSISPCSESQVKIRFPSCDRHLRSPLKAPSGVQPSKMEGFGIGFGGTPYYLVVDCDHVLGSPREP